MFRIDQRIVHSERGSAGCACLVEERQRIPQVGSLRDEAASHLEPHHARDVDGDAVVGGLEPVARHDVAGRGDLAERDDRVPGTDECRQESWQALSVFVSANAAGPEFAQVFVDEVVGHIRRDRVRITGRERRQVGRHDLATSVHLRDGTGARVWSNDPVADEDPDAVSPWMRDDWVSESAVPDGAVFAANARRTNHAGGVVGGRSPEPPAEDFEDRQSPPASRSSLGRRILGGTVVAALLIGSAGALLRDDPEATQTPTEPDDRSPTVSGNRSPTTTTTTPRDTIAPTTALSITVPPAVGAGDLIDIPDPIPSVVIGELPVWAERIIVVAENLAAMGPTEVITLSQAGIVNVTEFANGRTRSIDVSSVGAQAQMAFGDGTIVVFDSTTLWQIRDGEPVVESTLTDGVIFVQPWTGTGSFVVTTPATGADAPEQEWVLRADGSLQLLDDVIASESTFWSRVFSPTGESLVTRPGGVYAIDASAASTRRISSGDLLATGDRHWAIEECDETLRCTDSVIEWDTGTVMPGVLDALENFGVIDPATRISPDGRSITYRADTDGTGLRRILDVASGSTVEAGRINQFVYPDAWAADSSGLFITDRLLQFVDRTTGAITEFDGLDRVRAVATGPFSS